MLQSRFARGQSALRRAKAVERVTVETGGGPSDERSCDDLADRSFGFAGRLQGIRPLLEIRGRLPVFNPANQLARRFEHGAAALDELGDLFATADRGSIGVEGR